MRGYIIKKPKVYAGTVEFSRATKKFPNLSQVAAGIELEHFKRAGQSGVATLTARLRGFQLLYLTFNKVKTCYKNQQCQTHTHTLSLLQNCISQFFFLVLWSIPDFNETVRNMIKGHSLLYMYVH